MIAIVKCRWLFVCLALIAWTGVVCGPGIQKSAAQDAPKDAPKADDAKEAPKDAAAEPRPRDNMIVAWFKIIGLIGIGILLISVYFVATLGRLFVEMKMEVAMPPEIVDQCEDLLQQRDFKNIYNVVKEDDSFFSRVLSTGITELPSGLAEARESMERVGESVTVEMEKKISILAVLGTLGPMIGLLGTLKGMIASFSAIANSEGGGGIKPEEVAKGISEALWLTLLGVGLSVPAIYFFALFRNRVSNISVQTLLRADTFLRHFAHAARAKTTGGAAPAAAAKPVKA